MYREAPFLVSVMVAGEPVSARASEHFKVNDTSTSGTPIG